MIVRMFPYILTALLWLGFALVKLAPSSLWPVGITLSLLLGLSIYLVSGQRLWSMAFWMLLTTPFWLVISALSIMMIIESDLIRWLIVLAIPACGGMYCRQAYLYHNAIKEYQPYALENLSHALNLVVAFFTFSSLFGLKLLIGWGSSALLPLAVAVLGTVIYQVLWVNKKTYREGRIWALVVSLALLELFISLMYLPTSYVVNGLVMAVAFYLAVGLVRLAIQSSLEKRAVVRQVAIAAALIILTLGSARWI